MLLELLGIIMFGASLYMNYANVVLWNPIYSFLVQEALGALGVAIITKRILHRKRGRKR